MLYYGPTHLPNNAVGIPQYWIEVILLQIPCRDKLNWCGMIVCGRGEYTAAEADGCWQPTSPGTATV